MTAEPGSWSSIGSMRRRDVSSLPSITKRNLDKRHAIDNEVDPFRWLMASYNTLKKLNAAPVRVDELGRVWRIASN